MGQFWLTPVAAGKVLAFNRNLSGLALAHMITSVVKQHDLYVLRRITDWSDITRELSLVIDEELSNISRFSAGHPNSNDTIARENLLIQFDISPINDFSPERDESQIRKRLVLSKTLYEIPCSAGAENRDGLTDE